MAGPVYPWREGCQYELIVDGENFFPRILEYIRQAEKSIDIEMYLVSSGLCTAEVIEALCAAAGRGVAVRCVFDAAGSADLSMADRAKLAEEGVELRFFNPLHWRGGTRNLYRDHRKVLLFDLHTVCVGGLGFTDDFCTPQESGRAHWHDQMLVVTGPVVPDWLALFERQWQFAGKPLQADWLRFIPWRGSVPPHPRSGNGWGRVAYTDSRFNKELLKALLANIRRAESRIWLATPYFLPSWVLRRALQRAAARGVDVRLLLCGNIVDHPPVRYAGQRFYTRLLKSGVRIFEYQPRFLHLKTVLVDNWVSLGSCNFDHWALHWNLEANQNASDSALAGSVQRSFEADFAQSIEWTYKSWQELPWLHRLKIRLWGQINRLIMLWFNIRR